MIPSGLRTPGSSSPSAALAFLRDPAFWRRVLFGATVAAVAPAAAKTIFDLYVSLAPAVIDRLAHQAPTDVLLLYSHTLVIRSGGHLYWPWAAGGPDVLRTGADYYPLGRMPYPPFLTPALTPLSAAGLFAFACVWYTVVYTAVLVYAVSLAKLVRGKVTALATAAALAWLIVWPGTFGTLHDGNVDPILWALAGLALAWPAWRGPGFAVVALVKLWGVWPLAFVTQRMRVWTRAALTTLGATAISIAVLGPGRFFTACLDWAHYALPAVGQGYVKATNVSLSFAVLRLATVTHLWRYAGGPLPAGARIWLLLASVAAPLTAGILFQRSSSRTRLSAVITAALLFGPVCWIGYLPLLLLPLSVVLSRLFTLPEVEVAILPSADANTPLTGDGEYAP